MIFNWRGPVTDAPRKGESPHIRDGGGSGSPPIKKLIANYVKNFNCGAELVASSRPCFY